MKSGVVKLLKQTIFLGYVLLLCATSSYAQVVSPLPAGMPDAAVPGALPISKDVFLYPELEPEPGKYIVPPVVDRPLGVGEGPKIKIEAIDLRGANDHLDKGLKVDDVWKIIEKGRREHPEGLTIGQLQELATDITDFYRGKGFVVAHAFLPVQTVEDGIITIQILEGVLGRVLVEGAKSYKPEQLGTSFGHMIGQPLTKDEVESVLIRMGDYPGLTTFGVFQPGKNIGESDLILKVQEEDGGDGYFSIDNHGSRFTGEFRARFDIGVNNMLGFGDRIQLGFQKTAHPSNSVLHSFDYSQMLFSNPQYRVELGHSNTAFDIAPGDTGVEGLNGINREAYLRFRNDYERSRLRNSHWLFSITRKTAKTFRDEDRLARDHLAVLGIEWGFDSLDAETQGLNNMVVQFTHGEGSWLGAMDAHDDQSSSRRGGSGEFAGARFDKLFVSYTRLQTLSKTTSLLFRTNYQYTSNVLVALEQFAMGGPDSVRAYPVSEATMDRGIFVSLEHIWNAPGFADKPSWFENKRWGEVLTVSAFFDWAYGEKLDRLDTEDHYASLKGVGVASQLTLPGSFTAKMSLANTIMGAPFATNERRPQVYFSFETEMF